MRVTFPITVFAEPVKTNQAENNPTKVQISEKKSDDISLKNCFIYLNLLPAAAMTAVITSIFLAFLRVMGDISFPMFAIATYALASD